VILRTAGYKKPIDRGERYLYSRSISKHRKVLPTAIRPGMLLRFRRSYITTYEVGSESLPRVGAG